MTRAAVDAERLARHTLVQAAWPLALLALIGLACVVLAPPKSSTLRITIAIVGFMSAAATAFFSVVLVFDALLFRVIASHEDEEKGCAAVDDILARMRLRPLPATVRPLGQRAAGTRRVLMRQRLAFAISAIILVLILAQFPLNGA